MNWPNVALFLAWVLGVATVLTWMAALISHADYNGKKNARITAVVATILSAFFLLTGVWAAGVAR